MVEERRKSKIKVKQKQPLAGFGSKGKFFYLHLELVV
jgi:hypothetical protein